MPINADELERFITDRLDEWQDGVTFACLEYQSEIWTAGEHSVDVITQWNVAHVVERTYNQQGIADHIARFDPRQVDTLTAVLRDIVPSLSYPALRKVSQIWDEHPDFPKDA